MSLLFKKVREIFQFYFKQNKINNLFLFYVILFKKKTAWCQVGSNDLSPWACYQRGVLCLVQFWALETKKDTNLRQKWLYLSGRRYFVALLFRLLDKSPHGLSTKVNIRFNPTMKQKIYFNLFCFRLSKRGKRKVCAIDRYTDLTSTHHRLDKWISFLEHIRATRRQHLRWSSLITNFAQQQQQQPNYQTTTQDRERAHERHIQNN